MIFISLVRYMPYISAKKPLTQSQKDDLVHEAFSKVKNDSLDQARIIFITISQENILQLQNSRKST